jgi:hypothetical protein
MVVQPERLDWLANLNWLVDACDGDYFCYWQQDDVCAPDYLERLVSALREHPDAAGAYSDLRWFGRSTNEVVLPSITGSVRERLFAQMELQSWVPLRALVPVDVLRRIGHIVGLEGGAQGADKLWPLRLARAGALIRVPQVLYFKRDHAESLSHDRSRRWRFDAREAWLRLALAFFAELEPHVAPEERQDLAIRIADRFLVRRPGRTFRYDPVAAGDGARFAMEYFRALEAQAAVEAPLTDHDAGSEAGLQLLRSQRDRAAAGSVLRLVAEGLLIGPERRALVAAATRDGAITVDCSEAGQPGLVLAEGWSRPESWGTWSDGRQARLWLPLAGDGATWHLRLSIRPFLGNSEQPVSPRVFVSKDETVLLQERLQAGSVELALTMVAETGIEDGVILALDLPDAVSPAGLGAGPDVRQLTLGLQRIELRKMSDATPAEVTER